MTEEKKQELRQLLEKAMANLKIRDGYGVRLSLPEDVYRAYLQERWEHFGLDRFSPFWVRLTLDIGCETTKSRLLEFIRDTLAQFLVIDGDSITVAVYFIEHHSTNGPRLNRVNDLLRTIDVEFILTRLLDIAVVRGAEHAVSAFDACSRPEGSPSIFQRVSLVKGLTLKRDIEVCKGIRLVPLPDSRISDKVMCHIPNFPRAAFRYEFPNFSKLTLLTIDCPGLSMFHKPGPNQEFPQGLPVGDLPFKLEGHDVGYLDLREVESFRESFSRALSLSVVSPVEIPTGGLFPPGNGDSHKQNGTFSIRPIREGLFLAEDQTFSPRHASIVSLIPASRSIYFTKADENHIAQAKCLYKSLVDFNAKDRRKLLIAIDRWIKSKSSGSEADAIIDVGIALEALYVTEDRRIRELLSKRASLYLEDVSPQKTLQDEFKAIYKLRSDIVHSNVVREKVAVEDRCVPIPDLVARAQDLCQKSIVKIIKEGTIPDWNSLV